MPAVEDDDAGFAQSGDAAAEGDSSVSQEGGSSAMVVCIWPFARLVWLPRTVGLDLHNRTLCNANNEMRWEVLANRAFIIHYYLSLITAAAQGRNDSLSNQSCCSMAMRNTIGRPSVRLPNILSPDGTNYKLHSAHFCSEPPRYFLLR
jgi:hypothetical protein